jgi:hypothetical protein
LSSFVPFHDIGCSIDDQRIILNEKNPRNSQWRDVATPKLSNVSGSIDGARQILWKHAIYEIGFVKSKVRDTLQGEELTITNN